MTAGQQRHLAVGDHGIVLRRGNEGEVDGEGDDGDPDPQDDVGQIALETFLLDHQ